MHTITRTLLLNAIFIAALATVTELLFPKNADARPPIAILNISFPGNENTEPDRSVQFTVPDRDTSVSSNGGNLTRHEVHLSKLIELTHSYWCPSRPSSSGLYFDYAANNGKEFRGRFYITCQFAQETVDRYGLGKSERTELTDRRRSYSLNIPTLAPTDISAFKNRLADLKPACILQLCPGDRIQIK
jgi:hypothetical protein